MGEFKRTRSKVWWASESLEWREISQSSPGSQDSGFSDSETSPHFRNKLDAENNNAAASAVERLVHKLSPSTQKKVNLSANYKEKETPDKSIKSRLNLVENGDHDNNNMTKERNSRIVNINQYSEDITHGTTHTSISSEIINSSSSSTSWRSDSDDFKTWKSLPVVTNKNPSEYPEERLNTTAPAVLESVKDEELLDSHSLSSDCESELERLFNSPLSSPKHTSTPKVSHLSMNKIRSRKNKVCLSKKFQQEPKIATFNRTKVDNPAVKIWMQEIEVHCDPECMTTLNSKSIAAELTQELSRRAIEITKNITSILSHSTCIETDYKNLNGEQKHVAPLAQSLAGNIVDFLKQNVGGISAKVCKQYDEIRKTSSEKALKLVSELFCVWQSLFQDVLVREVKNIVERLENPRTELDLRATATALTSLCLRNENLSDIFVKCEAVPILLIFCEKCEGSTMRATLLRALATICCSSLAVRQFEKYSGVQVVADSLELKQETQRPEPERSEAVALLAQVTAPWIDENNRIKGLAEYTRSLVKSLTAMASETRCCQNLLLCSAALANLSSMEPRSLRFILRANTVQILLDKVQTRSSCITIYVLEQIATLIANISSDEEAREYLTNIRCVATLMSFFRAADGTGEEVEKRLQQKAIIALSRLCSVRAAAVQLVECGGVQKLVKLCRNRQERFDSDAVLVATLATLRKLAGTCGKDIVSSEDCQELVEPKLLDSFLTYSSQSESYV